MEKELIKIIEHYGIENQQRKLEEEVLELQMAITKFLTETEKFNYETDFYDFEKMDVLSNIYDNIVEEIADVLVILLQFIYLFEVEEDEIHKIFKYKVKRTLKKIEKEEENEHNRI